MKDEEREQLVTELTNYIGWMASHQRERMGGKLLIRCRDMLKTLRVLELTEPEHCAKLLEKESYDA